MQKIKAFFKLIRWPNLLMIMVAQSLLNYMVIGHILKLVHVDLPLTHFQFILLMISTVFMAAWGYAFNDVEDEKVDAIKVLHECWKDGRMRIRQIMLEQGASPVAAG